MAHPLHHSLSSVRKFGGKTDDYIALHSYFDQTKSHYADFRHRAIRHHLEGIERAVKIFGVVLYNADQVPVTVKSIGEQHVVEDCERLVSVSDWREHMITEPWMKPSSKAKEFLPHKTWGGALGDYQFIVDYYDTCEPFVNHHSAGCFDLEQEKGYWIVNSDNKPVPVRTLAEQYLNCRYGRIPSPSEWLRNIRPQPWMIRTQKIHRTL